MTSHPVPEPLARLLATRPVSVVHWGLERTEALLEQLGHPERTFESFHVAGTNGKGSTCGFAAELLRVSGRRTGLYTSPHLEDVRERFAVDGEWVPDDVLGRAAERVLACDVTPECSYFEVVTVVAFLSFAEVGVEAAVIETGMGGRLDSTNVLAPRATAITPIALDHMAMLGETIEAIAAEKAGILKSGVPVAVGRLAPEPEAVIRDAAEDAGAPMVALGVDATVSEVHSDLSGTSFLYESETRAPLALRTRLPGSHQADNAGLALLMLDAAGVALSDEDVAKGVARGVVPGRFEVRTTPAGTYVLDAAHNPAAVTALAETLRDVEPPGPVIAVVGVLSDKDWAPMLDRLAVDVDHVILTRPSSAPAARTWDPDAVAAGVSRERASHVTVCAEMVEALSEARARAGEGTVLVTGSSHTVGEAKGVLGPGGERPGA